MTKTDSQTTGTTYDKERGRVDWGVTLERTVVYHTAWPNRPYLSVSGLFAVSVSAAGFQLDRKPDGPIYWIAQERPANVFEIDNIRRMLKEVPHFHAD